MSYRLALVALAITSAACSAPARAPITQATPAQAYTLQPIQGVGDEGRHSSSHSRTLVRGSLELRATQAKLTLDITTDVSFVHCPPQLESGKVHSMQQCANRSTKPYATQERVTLIGEARWTAGRLVAKLSGDKRSIELSCTESFVGLTCTGGWSLLRHGHPLVFATTARKHFELEPRDTLTGALELAGEVAKLTLTRANHPSVEIAGRMYWAQIGLVIEANTSPTRTITLHCTDADRRLACEITADRSVLGEADHLYGPVVFVARDS